MKADKIRGPKAPHNNRLQTDEPGVIRANRLHLDRETQGR